MQKFSQNIEDTKKIAEEFLKNLLAKLSLDKKNQAMVVGLYGELGTGKTTFTQTVAKILGVKRKVNSPTYVIMKNYPIGPIGKASVNPSANFKKLVHLDAYRLKNEKELLALGWEAIISDPENLIFIEWPENVIKAMPKKHHRIHISHTKKGDRKFKIKTH